MLFLPAADAALALWRTHQSTTGPSWKFAQYNPLARTRSDRIDDICMTFSDVEAVAITGTQLKARELDVQRRRVQGPLLFEAGWKREPNSARLNASASIPRVAKHLFVAANS